MGFEKTETLHSLRIDGPDKPGLGAKITAALAEGGINLRGLSAVVIGKRFALYLAFDRSADATKAVRLAKKLS